MLIKLNEIKQIIKEELYYYLLEVKIGDLKRKYPDQSQLIDQLSKSIPNKFLEWSLLNYKEGMDLSQLSQQLQQLEQNIKRGKIKDDVIPKDIGQWKAKGVTLDTIIKVNQEASQVKTGREEKKEQKMEGSKTWHDDNHYLIVEPKTMEASCYYGRGTKWCISAKEDNMFNSYSNTKGFNFLFIIDKQKEQNDPLYKVALVLKEGKILESYNAEDTKIYNFKDDGKSNIFLNKLYGNFSNKILKIIKEMKIESEKMLNEPSFVRKYGISENIKQVKFYFDNLENAKYNEEWGWIIERDFDMIGFNIKKLPNIYKVGGNFKCLYNQLTSLEGSPREVGGDFNCQNNNLTSLEGASQKVGGDFYCNKNKLTSLKGAPKKINDFYCNENQLISLEGSPLIVNGTFNCSNNQLTSLEGAPQEVGFNFYCKENNLKDKTLPPNTKVGGKVFF